MKKQRGEVAELVYRTRLESESTFTGTVSSNLTLSAIVFFTAVYHLRRVAAGARFSGFAVLDQLKRDSATRNIPVVVCTSLDLTDSERSQLMLDAVAILEKQHLDRVRAAQVMLQVFDQGVASAMPNAVGSHGS